MQLWGITDRGSVRKENQDTYILCTVDEGNAFAVVCDGMGGAKAGNVASKLAAETFAEDLRAQLPPAEGADLSAVLTELAARANKVVYGRSLECEECSGMGTTMVAAVLSGESVCVLNVGDSRCYLVDEQSIAQVTRDHSLVGDLVAHGEITPEEAKHHPNRNIITRALGAEEEVHSDVFSVEHREGTYLLLCSDGLSNVVSDPEIQFEIIHGDSPETCCGRLLDIALTRGAPDNVTAVLVQL